MLKLSLQALFAIPFILIILYRLYGYWRWSGVASDINDGDGFILRRRRLPALRVRILGIDAPEKGQPYASASRTTLARLLRHPRVRLIPRGIDQYGRRVARVQVGGYDVGYAMLLAGAAWYYRHYARDLPWITRWRYAAAERSARIGRRGLWAAKGTPRTPWSYKHRSWLERLLRPNQ